MITVERLPVHQPSHPNSNIHGMVNRDGTPTCRTHGVNMCTGCCYALQITHNSQADGEVLKEAGEMCDAQVPTEGCAHVINGQINRRYPVCPIYHCSADKSKLQNVSLPRKERIAAFQRLNWMNLAAFSQGEIDITTFRGNEKSFGEAP